MQKPKIDYKYWLEKWHQNVGKSNVLKVSYSSFRGTLHECEKKILEIVKSPNLKDEMILNAIDLINQWGGKMSRGFYLPKSKIKSDGSILVRIPRQVIEEQENIDRYKEGIKLAKQNDLNSVNYFRQFGIGPSYIGKHAYFWSNCNLPIVDAKIAGCLGYQSSQMLLAKNSYNTVVEFFNSIKIEEKLNHNTEVEKAMFAFHRNFFTNDNLALKSNIQDKTDRNYAIELAQKLNIKIPDDLLKNG